MNNQKKPIVFRPSHIYTENEVSRMLDHNKQQYLQKLEALTALHDMQRLIDLIDFQATLLPKDERDARFKEKRYAEQLAAAWTRFIGECQNCNLDPTRMYPDSTKRVTNRINGIQRLSKDGGEFLLDTIASMPGDMGELARWIREKPTQGKSIEPENRRLFQYAEEQRRGGYGWKDVGLEIIRQLENQEQLDDTDRSLLDTLRYCLDKRGKDGLHTYVETAHKNYKRSKTHKRESHKRTV